MAGTVGKYALFEVTGVLGILFALQQEFAY